MTIWEPNLCKGTFISGNVKDFSSAIWLLCFRYEKIFKSPAYESFLHIHKNSGWKCQEEIMSDPMCVKTSRCLNCLLDVTVIPGRENMSGEGEQLHHRYYSSLVHIAQAKFHSVLFSQYPHASSFLLPFPHHMVPLFAFANVFSMFLLIF